MNYFLWDKRYNGPCKYNLTTYDGEQIYSVRYLKNEFSDTVIRNARQLSIIEKARIYDEATFANCVSTQNPYGFRASLFNEPQQYPKAGLCFELKDGFYKIYGVKGIKGGAKRIVGYVSEQSVEKGNDNINKYKLLFSKAYSSNTTVPPTIIKCLPGEICTETFLQIGPFEFENDADNCLSYIKTKFFRALLFFGRAGMNISQKSFEFVPLQDFTDNSDINWNTSVHNIDKQLYKKYGLSKDEIDFIEAKIKPME